MLQRRAQAQVRALVVALAAIALGGGLPSIARADGDPASDFLLVQNVFYPYQPKVSGSVERALEGTLASVAHATNVPFKAAIIESPADLGLDPQFFGHPQAYAMYLDHEISFNSPERPLITVMPSGFGVIPARYAPALAHVQVDSSHGSDGLARSTIAAALALSRYLGHPVSSSQSVAATTSTSSSPGLVVFALPVGLLVIGGLIVTMRRQARSRAESTSPDD